MARRQNILYSLLCMLLLSLQGEVFATYTDSSALTLFGRGPQDTEVEFFDIDWDLPDARECIRAVVQNHKKLSMALTLAVLASACGGAQDAPFSIDPSASPQVEHQVAVEQSGLGVNSPSLNQIGTATPLNTTPGWHAQIPQSLIDNFKTSFFNVVAEGQRVPSGYHLFFGDGGVKFSQNGWIENSLHERLVVWNKRLDAGTCQEALVHFQLAPQPGTPSPWTCVHIPRDFTPAAGLTAPAAVAVNSDFTVTGGTKVEGFSLQAKELATIRSGKGLSFPDIDGFDVDDGYLPEPVYVVTGDAFQGSRDWYAFPHKGKIGYVHASLFNKVPKTSAPVPQR